jgi:hypothetical protein
LTGYDKKEISQRILEVAKTDMVSNGRDKISHLDEAIIANRIIQVYQKVLDGRK